MKPNIPIQTEPTTDNDDQDAAVFSIELNGPAILRLAEPQELEGQTPEACMERLAADFLDALNAELSEKLGRLCKGDGALKEMSSSAKLTQDPAVEDGEWKAAITIQAEGKGEAISRSMFKELGDKISGGKHGYGSAYENEVLTTVGQFKEQVEVAINVAELDSRVHLVFAAEAEINYNPGDESQSVSTVRLHRNWGSFANLRPGAKTQGEDRDGLR